MTPSPYSPELSQDEANLVLSIAILMAHANELSPDLRYGHVRILWHAVEYLSYELDAKLSAKKIQRGCA